MKDDKDKKNQEQNPQNQQDNDMNPSNEKGGKSEISRDDYSADDLDALLDDEDVGF